MYLIKGQLISKGLLDVFKSTKKPTPFLKGFLPLFLERGQIKKDKVYLVYLIKFFYFFDSTSFEILTKISLGLFLVDLKIPKNPFEINWPKALFSKNSKPERNLLLLLLDFLKGKSFTPPRSFLYISQWGEFSHYIEVARGAIFMGKKRRFGLILGQLAILKKKVWADYEQLLRAFS